MNMEIDRYAGMRPEEFAEEIGRFDHQLEALKAFLRSLKSTLTALHEPDANDFTRTKINILGCRLDTLFYQVDHWMPPTYSGSCPATLPDTPPLGLRITLQAREQEWQTLRGELNTFKSLLDQACIAADSDEPKEKTPSQVTMLSNTIIKLVVAAEYGRSAFLELFPLPTSAEIRKALKDNFTG
jgi:hypothetical protein